MKHVPCNCCNSPASSPLYRGPVVRGTAFSVVACPRCGLAWTDPQPDEVEILSYYDQDYYGFNNIRFRGLVERFVRFARVLRARKLRRFIRAGRVLDIGCGRGIYLDALRRKGFQTVGIELSDTAARYAREGLMLDRIFVGRLEDMRFPDRYFDAVSIFHVLEHLPRPSGTLREVGRILAPGGVLVVAFPNIRSLQARIFRRLWFHLDIPRHLFHFSPRSLDALLPSREWELVGARGFSLEYGPFGWVQSALNVVFGNENTLYSLLKEKASGTLAAYTKRRFRLFRWTLTALNLLAGALLVPPAIALSLALDLCGDQEMIERYYRRRP